MTDMWRGGQGIHGAPRLRPTVVVVWGPESRERHWSPAAEKTLADFADRVDVHLAPSLEEDERQALLDGALREADALLICGWGGQGIGFLTPERLSRAPRLSFFGSTTHYHQAELVDIAAARSHGIAMSETAPAMSPWVAEYELTMALAALRRLPQEHALVGAGGWLDFAEAPDVDRLHGRRLGLVGFGAIHRHLARLLGPFETDWEAYSPHVSKEAIEASGGRMAESLTAMAFRSEILFVATPPTPQSLGLVNREVIYALGRGSLFVLVSRMAVVEQQPLIERLLAGDLRAAIDVYEPEPPPLDNPLRWLPNVIHTPHRAGNTFGAHRAVFIAQCQEAKRHFAGEPLEYPLLDEIVDLFKASAHGE